MLKLIHGSVSGPKIQFTKPNTLVQLWFLKINTETYIVIQLTRPNTGSDPYPHTKTSEKYQFRKWCFSTW